MSCCKNDNISQESRGPEDCNLCPALNFIVTLIDAFYRHFFAKKQKAPIGRALTDECSHYMFSYTYTRIDYQNQQNFKNGK